MQNGFTVLVVDKADCIEAVVYTDHSSESLGYFPLN